MTSMSAGMLARVFFVEENNITGRFDKQEQLLEVTMRPVRRYARDRPMD